MFNTFRRRYPVARQRDPGPKVPVYRVKGTGLRGERHHSTGRKAPVYGVKGTGLQGDRSRATSGRPNRAVRWRGGRFSGPLQSAKTERYRSTGRTGTALQGDGPKVPVYGVGFGPDGAVEAGRRPKGTGLQGGPRMAPVSRAARSRAPSTAPRRLVGRGPLTVRPAIRSGCAR